METRELQISETAPGIPDPGGFAPAAPSATGFRPYRISMDRYQKMVETGCLGEKEPVFLWHGRLVEKMPKGPSHTYSLNKLAKRFDRLVPEGWFTEQEAAMALSDDSMPEPDLKVVRGSQEDFKKRAPSTREVALIIEVADSSLAVDSGEVLEAYALEAIPVYWLVNIPERRIEVYSHPEGSRYRDQRNYLPGKEVPVILDDREVDRIAVDDILF